MIRVLKRWAKNRALERAFRSLARMCDAAGDSELASCVWMLWKIAQRGGLAEVYRYLRSVEENPQQE
jgi:hypothetical protein